MTSDAGTLRFTTGHQHFCRLSHSSHLMKLGTSALTVPRVTHSHGDAASMSDLDLQLSTKGCGYEGSSQCSCTHDKQAERYLVEKTAAVVLAPAAAPGESSSLTSDSSTSSSCPGRSPLGLSWGSTKGTTGMGELVAAHAGSIALCAPECNHETC